MIFLLIIILLFPVSAFASGTCTSTSCTGTSPWTAENCNQDTVNYCLANCVASTGTGTIILPACNVSWTSAVTMNASSRNLTLIGNGATDDANGTIITSNVNGALTVTGGDGYTFDVSNIVFKGDGTNSGQDYHVRVYGTSKAWRIHNNAFKYAEDASWPNMMPYAVILINGYTYGLIDANIVSGKFVREFVYVESDDVENWGRTQSFGDVNAVYVENNTITWQSQQEGRPVVEGSKGGRFVCRYNTVQNSRPGGHGFDTGSSFGIMSQEVYNNAFNFVYYSDSWSDHTWDALGQARSGTGVWYDNAWTFDSGITWVNGGIRLRNYRSLYETGSENSWKTKCDGIDNTMVCSNVDINWAYLGGGVKQVCHAGVDSDCPSTYTCKWLTCLRDGHPSLQLCDPANGDDDCDGNGTCTSYLDGSDSGYPCFQQPGRSTNNTLKPFYSWNNTATWTGHSNPSTALYGSPSSQIVSGRDFYNSTSMSDAKANGFQADYSPYTCPHPLATELAGKRCNSALRGSGVAGGYGINNILIGAGAGSMTTGTGGTITW